MCASPIAGRRWKPPARSESGCGAGGDDQRNLELEEILCQPGQRVEVAIGVARLERHVATLDVAELAHLLVKGSPPLHARACIEQSDHARPGGGLRAGSPGAKQRNTDGHDRAASLPSFHGSPRMGNEAATLSSVRRKRRARGVYPRPSVTGGACNMARSPSSEYRDCGMAPVASRLKLRRELQAGL
jgi:hypothetical protein